MKLKTLQTFTLGFMLTLVMTADANAAQRLARYFSQMVGAEVTPDDAVTLAHNPSWQIEAEQTQIKGALLSPAEFIQARKADPDKPRETLVLETRLEKEVVKQVAAGLADTPDLRARTQEIVHLMAAGQLDESAQEEAAQRIRDEIIHRQREVAQREKEAQDDRQLLKARAETEERQRQEEALLKEKSEKEQMHVAEVFSLAPEEDQRVAIEAGTPRVIEEEKEHQVRESKAAKEAELKVDTTGKKKRKEITETAHTERKKTKTAVTKTSEVFHDPQEGTIEKERKGMPIIPLPEEPKNHNIEEFREDYKRFLKKTSARFPAVFSDRKNVESLIVDDSSLENGYIPLRKALTASLSILKPLVDDPQLENVHIQLKKALTTSLSVLKSSKPAALSEEKGALPDVGESVGKVYSSENSDAESNVEMKEEERANDESLVLPHDPQDGKIKKERKGTPVIPLNEEQMQQQLEVVCGAYEHFLKRAFTKYRDLFSDPEIDKDPIFHPINIDPLLYKLLGQVVGDLKRENGRGRKLPHKALTDSLFNPLRPTPLLEEEGSSQETDQSADETYSSQNSDAVSGDEMSEEESDSVQNSQEWENGGT